MLPESQNASPLQVQKSAVLVVRLLPPYWDDSGHGLATVRHDQFLSGPDPG
jgi:hypothetical protein